MVLLELLLAAAAAAVLLLLPPAAAASFCCCCCCLLPLLLPAAAAAALFLHWGYDWLKSKEYTVPGKERMVNELINAVVPRDASWATQMNPKGSIIERICLWHWGAYRSCRFFQARSFP